MPKERIVLYSELPDHGVPPYSRMQLKRLMRNDQFPLALQISPNKIGWKLSEIERWKESRPVALSAKAPVVYPPGRHPGRTPGSKVIDGKVVAPKEEGADAA